MKRSTRQHVFATANSILQAARDRGFDDTAFRQVSAAKASDVIGRVHATFGAGRRAGEARPLWERLGEPSASRGGPHELSALLGLGPAHMPVLLLVEDPGAKQADPLWVFEASLAAAIATLENHHGLEYYIVPRSFEWLITENHHNVLIAAGRDAASVLARIST
jgi:hypothetical protein